jgi:hypothetical protein
MEAVSASEVSIYLYKAKRGNMSEGSPIFYHGLQPQFFPQPRDARNHHHYNTFQSLYWSRCIVTELTRTPAGHAARMKDTYCCMLLWGFLGDLTSVPCHTTMQYIIAYATMDTVREDFYGYEIVVFGFRLSCVVSSCWEIARRRSRWRSLLRVTRVVKTVDRRG